MLPNSHENYEDLGNHFFKNMPYEMENSQLMKHISTIQINPKYLDMQLPPNSPDRTFGHLKKKKSSIAPLQICSRLMLTIPALNRCFPCL